MKWLVDAQLPLRLVKLLRSAGHDAIHTFDMTDGNQSDDRDIAKLADDDGRIVVTKDSDFVDSYFLKKEPEKLLLVSTGNIKNRDLESLVVPFLAQIETEFASASFLELTTTGLITRG